MYRDLLTLNVVINRQISEVFVYWCKWCAMSSPTLLVDPEKLFYNKVIKVISVEIMEKYNKIQKNLFPEISKIY